MGLGLGWFWRFLKKVFTGFYKFLEGFGRFWRFGIRFYTFFEVFGRLWRFLEVFGRFLEGF